MKKRATVPDGDGDCYEAAAEQILNYKLEGLLVHGYPTLQVHPYCRYGHAWVECGDIVWEVSNGNHLAVPKTMYYKAGNINESECFKYTAEEIRKNVVHYKHWGPWDGPDGCPPIADEE